MATLPEAFYFGPPDRPLFGIWHAPEAPGSRSLAVVLVGPWGIEGMSLQRTWRQFAMDLAREGFPVLRFDLDGCGDSYDPSPDTNFWPLWMSSLSRAKQTALSFAGVEQVALVGFRMGALLAASHVCAEPEGIRALVLMAPQRSGNACVRELKMLEVSTSRGTHDTSWAVVTAGFGMNDATFNALKSVPLPEEIPRGIQVAIIDRQEAPLGKGWTQKLATKGIASTHVVVPGYPDMMQIAHKVSAAPAFFREAIASLLKASESSTRHDRNARGSRPSDAWTLLDHKGKVLREWALPPLGTKGMAAIVVQDTQRASPSANRKAVLILNSGAEHRVGPNRMWVGWARDFAAAGHTVVRLDLPGLGESLGDNLHPSTQVYRDDAIQAIQDAMNTLGEQLKVTQWALMGLCSGAYHAIGAALSDPRVVRVVAINPFVFFPAQLHEIDLLANNAMDHMVTANTLKSAKDPKRWMRLVRGESNVRLIVQSLVGRTRTKVTKRSLDLGRMLKLVPISPQACRLTEATARGCRFHFVFDADEPGWAILKEDIGNLADRMIENGRFTLDTIAHGDHAFATLKGRAQMLYVTQSHLQGWAGQPN